MLTGRYQRSFDGSAGRRPRSAPSRPRCAALDDDPVPARRSVTTPATRSAATARSSAASSTGSHRRQRLRLPRPHGRARARTHQLRRRARRDSRRAAAATRQTTYQPTHDLPPGRRVRVPRLAALPRARTRSPAEFRIQPFFVWYAPRIPHQPLRSPPPIRDYLFGAAPTTRWAASSTSAALCNGGVCPPTVTAINESELRHRLRDVRQRVVDGRRPARDPQVPRARRASRTASAPTAAAASTSRRRAARGTWAATITPEPGRQHDHHHDGRQRLAPARTRSTRFTENGYRTRLIVFDPRALPSVPGWDAEPGGDSAGAGEPRAGALDRHPRHHRRLRARHARRGRSSVRRRPDGTRCDGKDLRPLPRHRARRPGRRRSRCATRSAARHQADHHGPTNALPAHPRGHRRPLHQPGRAGVRQRRATAAAARLHRRPLHAAHRAGVQHARRTCPTGAACLGSKCRVGAVVHRGRRLRGALPRAELRLRREGRRAGAATTRASRCTHARRLPGRARTAAPAAGCASRAG